MDNFETHEGTLYCKPHFRALFTPKAVEDDTPGKLKDLCCWYLVYTISFRKAIDKSIFIYKIKIITAKPRKHELIIRENQPAELPPDVARGIN